MSKNTKIPINCIEPLTIFDIGRRVCIKKNYYTPKMFGEIIGFYDNEIEILLDNEQKISCHLSEIFDS